MRKQQHVLIVLIKIIIQVVWCSKYAVDHAEETVVKPYKMSNVLHLNQNMRRWRQGYDDSDTETNTYLDFKTKSSALRIDADYPMKIPEKFTWCAQYKVKIMYAAGYGTRISFLQMGSTTHGNSVLEDYLNPNMTHSKINQVEANLWEIFVYVSENFP